MPLFASLFKRIFCNFTYIDGVKSKALPKYFPRKNGHISTKVKNVLPVNSRRISLIERTYGGVKNNMLYS